MEYRRDAGQSRQVHPALVMDYVPWQSWEKLYEEKVALERGTLFPSLDYPFTGKEVCRR